MKNFSSISAVKAEAGLTTNPNIANSTVQSYLDEASAVVQSYVAKKYDIASLLVSSYLAGSQGEFVIKMCEELYAAGSVLNKEFGYEEGANTGSGDGKIKRALETLALVVKGDMILIGTDGVEFPSSVTASNLPPVGSPSSNTDRKFSMSDSTTL